jgi:hypothetical protein
MGVFLGRRKKIGVWAFRTGWPRPVRYTQDGLATIHVYLFYFLCMLKLYQSFHDVSFEDGGINPFLVNQWQVVSSRTRYQNAIFYSSAWLLTLFLRTIARVELVTCSYHLLLGGSLRHALIVSSSPTSIDILPLHGAV